MAGKTLPAMAKKTASATSRAQAKKQPRAARRAKPVEPPVPRIESLQVKNYRALHDFRLDNLSPLTVLLGPNGSGKSTVFDVFAFLSECFSSSFGIREALRSRNGLEDLRTRGAKDPLVFEIKYRESVDSPLLTYSLTIDLDKPRGKPIVIKELLRDEAAPFPLLHFGRGKGLIGIEDEPGVYPLPPQETLDSPDLLAVSALGQLARHPHVAALRRFITGWHLSYLTADNTRGTPDAGPQEHLSQTGDNLPNVIQYLREQHPERLDAILDTLRRRVPRLQTVTADPTPDGRLLLQIKDAPFDRPVLARFASDGTLKLLAYLTVLHDPHPPQLIGIEEPENQLHPRLLPELAEECRAAAERTQLMVTSHSPFFVNELRPEEVWVLYRDERGYTQACNIAGMERAMAMYKEGGKLGSLWMEGFFDVGDPLQHEGGPAPARTKRGPRG